MLNFCMLMFRISVNLMASIRQTRERLIKELQLRFPTVHRKPPNSSQRMTFQAAEITQSRL